MMEKEKEIKSQKELLDKREKKIKNKENNYNDKIELLKNKEKENSNKDKEFQINIEKIKNKENELKERENDIFNREKELNNKIVNLNKREEEIIKRENEINKKNGSLGDKENYLEQDLKKIGKNEKEILQNNILLNPIKNNINNVKPNIQNQINNTNHKRVSSAPKIPVKEEPIKRFINTPLIGLKNIGLSSFKNSVLQCFSQTKELTNYFLREKSRDVIFNNNIAKKNKEDLQLCPVFYELIQNLWYKSGRAFYSPDKFLKIVDEMCKYQVLNFKPQDSKDFIIFILEQLHKELQKSIKTNSNHLDDPLNQYDKVNTFNHFIEDFKENTSIISDLFFGINETNTICLNCKNNYNAKGINNPISYNYGIFNCLIFPLEEVKKMKMQSKPNNYMIFNINTVSLRDCFLYNQKTGYFTGQNRNYCNLCKQLSVTIYTNKIYSSPKYLILIMNRGKSNVFKIPLDFGEYLDLNQFVIQKDMKMIYNLYGVISQTGESGLSEHYVAACKSPIDNKWYRYNDINVIHINNFDKDVYNFGRPYILFYQKE